MKIKIEFYFVALFLALSLNSPVMSGHVLDGTKVVSDEDDEWLRGEGVVSTSKFIRQARALDPEELAEIDTLNLQGTMLYTVGLKKVAEELLPFLPNLKLLNLFDSDLRTEEDLELLASILQRFENLEYVNIVGNRIANQALSFVKQHQEQKDLIDKFQHKVVFSFKTLLEDKFPIAERRQFEDWYKTHTSYYTSVH